MHLLSAACACGSTDLRQQQAVRLQQAARRRHGAPTLRLRAASCRRRAGAAARRRSRTENLASGAGGTVGAAGAARVCDSCGGPEAAARHLTRAAAARVSSRGRARPPAPHPALLLRPHCLPLTSTAPSRRPSALSKCTDTLDPRVVSPCRSWLALLRAAGGPRAASPNGTRLGLVLAGNPLSGHHRHSAVRFFTCAKQIAVLCCSGI